MKKILFLILITFNILLYGDVLQILNESNCMKCHNLDTSKLAPSFKEIGIENVNSYGLEARYFLARSILDGSKGKYKKFKNTEMPSFKYLKLDKVDKITQWIVDNFNNNKILNNFKIKE